MAEIFLNLIVTINPQIEEVQKILNTETRRKLPEAHKNQII